MNLSELNKLLSNLPQYSPSPEELHSIEMSTDYPYDNYEKIIFDDYEIDDSYGEEKEDWDQEELHAIEGGVRGHGIDILAFYKSFRFINDRPFPGKWGIFYVNRGVAYLNFLLQSEFPGFNFKENYGLEFLRLHETYHAKFDQSILGLEVAANKHFYLPQIHAFKRHQSQNPEEAIANYVAFKYLSSDKFIINPIGFSDFFFDFMKRQTGAYSRFDEPLNRLQTELASGILDGVRYKNSNTSSLGKWMGFLPPFTYRKSDIPEYFIRNVNFPRLVSPAKFIPQVKIITEHEKFKKMLFPGHESIWNSTKTKLLNCAVLGGLDFKVFPPAAPYWSVRVNDNFRAHLNPISIKDGEWMAMEYGDHKKLKHG
jgi:hypothetical protein